MEIIKEGEIKDLLTPESYECHCPNCGCVFVISEEERKKQHNETTGWIKCPSCNEYMDIRSRNVKQNYNFLKHNG